MKKADEVRGELARLEEQPARITAAALAAGRELEALNREGSELARQLERVRFRWVTDGPSEALDKEMAKLDARIAVVPAERERIEGILAATRRAQQANADQRERLLKDHLDIFRDDAATKAAEAEGKLRSLAPAIAEAQAAWEEASLEWQRLSRALSEAVRERDEKAGVHRDSGHYASLGSPPPFPLPSALAVPCRPRAVDLLAEPAKPRTMKRVA